MEGFPNALLKLQETDNFVLTFFSKAAENKDLRYFILLQNYGKRKLSLWYFIVKLEKA